VKLFGVILNYKTADMTLGAATALARALEHVPDSRFAIVDNDSQDGSYEKLKSAVAKSPFRDRCTVLASPDNGGFGAGNNFAIRPNLHSDDPADYYLLLNSDAVPSELAIKRMYDFMTSHPDAGICGAYVHGPDGEPHHTAFRFPSAFSELEEQAQTGPISKLVAEHIVALQIPDHTTEVPWTAAVCMMLRRETVKKIGLFDETFFLYYEETDLCRRARDAGYKIYYVREAEVSHIGSVSTGMKRFDKPMPLYWFEARKHYFRKHHGDGYSLLADVAWLAGRSVCALRRLIDHRAEERRPHFTRDFIKFNLAPSLARK
jgi:N-acetylglucosaminyl-diphospho-decaprenol L-rhamnosyltransferase